MYRYWDNILVQIYTDITSNGQQLITGSKFNIQHLKQRVLMIGNYNLIMKINYV